MKKEKIKEEVESPKHDRRVKEEPKSPTQHRHHQVSMVDLLYWFNNLDRLCSGGLPSDVSG